MQRFNKTRSTCAVLAMLLAHVNGRRVWLENEAKQTSVRRWDGPSRIEKTAWTRDYAEAASEHAHALPKKLHDVVVKRRVLVEGQLSPWIQPSTFLRVALLIIRNAALGNPGAGMIQSILTTELAYTAFTNLFASFGGAFVSDFSQGLVNEATAGSAWVVDGETTLENVLASEFIYGGAFGFEQFYGFGFEISGDAAAALQQSLQPDFDTFSRESETFKSYNATKQNVNTLLRR